MSDAPAEVPQPPVGDASVYRIAYDHGMRALDEQRDELNGVRTRAVQFLAFVGAATAFLVGTGLGGAPEQGDRSGGFYAVAVLGTVFTIAALVSLVCALSPWREFSLSLDAQVLVTRWIDRDVPRAPSEPALVRALALKIAEMVQSNDAPLASVRCWYLATVVCGTLALISWAALVWLFA